MISPWRSTGQRSASAAAAANAVNMNPKQAAVNGGHLRTAVIATIDITTTADGSGTEGDMWKTQAPPANANIEMRIVNRYAMPVPLRLLKKLSPRRSQLADRWFLRPFGAMIHDPALWRLDRHGAARAFALGLFIAWMPIPMQMAAAAVLALWLRIHLPVAVLAVWVSNPVTFVPMVYVAYLVGVAILGTTGAYWQPLLVGSLILGVLTAAAGYFLLDLLWHWSLVRKYHRIKAAGRRRMEVRDP